jgi:DNA-binding MarR family transcriptional regulator
MQNRTEPDAGRRSGGDVEVLQAATRVLTGVALKSLRLLARDLPLPRFRLLLLLDEWGPSPAEPVADALGLGSSALSRAADRLVAAGYLVRRRDPERPTFVTLEATPAGRDVVARVMHWRQRELGRMLDRMDPAGRAAATEGARRLVEAARAIGTVAPA